MIKIIQADGKSEKLFLERLRKRSEENDRVVSELVTSVIDDVRRRGDQALIDCTLRFDRVVIEKTELTREEIERAAESVNPDVKEALDEAAANIRDFHERQKQQSWIEMKGSDIALGQQIRGLGRVGIYVPGGTAAYPSSVLMNAIPAKVAGVREIVMVTPPPKDGKLNPDILYAAQLAGVDRIFTVGGAQAIAALAYGTETVPKVDKIVGPGNIYVATAKRHVFGVVDIDMIAGPSEILIVADESAQPSFLAADLMSQAEHDSMASSILITTSARLVQQTIDETAKQLGGLSRGKIIKESLEQNGVAIVCSSLRQALEIADEFAPEHLELMVEKPMELLGSIRNAGSVFLGNYSPEPLGDYFAGPNHVLPTGGTARFFSPLSVDTFTKKMSFISYSADALYGAKEKIITLAEAEGLTAHANSVRVRFQQEQDQ